MHNFAQKNLNLNQSVHFLIHSLPSKVYRILSESVKQTLIKLHSVNTQSSHDLEQRALLKGESADLDKWANVTMRSSLSSAAEARPGCLYSTCCASGMVATALGWFCCFPSWLARPRPRLMVDWTRKRSAEICREAVKLSASLPALQLSCDWQRWINRWLNGPVLTTVSDAFSSLDSAAFLFLCHSQINSFYFLTLVK